MKKILIVSMYVLVSIFLCNCIKKKTCGNIQMGTYSGRFTTSNGTMLYDPSIQITEVSESSLLINGSNISRDNCSIVGTVQYMSLLYQGGPVTIQGKIDKKNGRYIIEGSFNTFQGSQAYPVSGTFEIKSN